MRIAQIQTFDSPDGGRPLNPLLIAQQQILGMSKEELAGLVTGEKIKNPILIDASEEASNATKFDKLKQIAIGIDYQNIQVAEIVNTLKGTNLSQEAIDIFLETAAEKLIRENDSVKAIKISKYINNKDIVTSIEYQVNG